MKLQTKKVFFVGLAFLIICMFWQVYDNVISKMLINTFGLNQTWSGIVMALDNVFALFLLPIFGALSDKTKTKYGKRTPYIFIGTIVAAIFLVGVSLFDNMQMSKLEEANVGYVVTVNNNLKDENNEYHYLLEEKTEEEINDIFDYHYGDYWYQSTLTDEQMDKLLGNNIKENVKKYFSFVDISIPEGEFKENYIQNYLSPKDKERFSEIISMTPEERYKLEFSENLGLLDKVLGKEPTIVATRVHQKEIDALNEVLIETLCDIYKEDLGTLKMLLKEVGVRQFFTVKENATQVRGAVAWEYTKGNIGYLIGFLGILLLVLIAMATFRTPAVSLMPDVVIKPLRSKANAIINLMGTVGGIISLLIMSFLAKDYHSYMLLFIIIGLLMIILLVIFLFTVDENKLVEERIAQEKEFAIEEVEEVATENIEEMPKDVRKSFYLIIASIILWFMAYNAATTKFSVYAGDVLNMGYSIPLLVANATALICYIPIGMIASKVGRKKTILAGIIILFTAFFLGSIATESTKVLIYFTMGLAGIGWATINVNSYPMVVEMSKNSNVGKYTGYYYTASMFAQIITPIISGVFMDLCGTMRVLFPYSVFFCVCAFITMSLVKHGDSKPIAVKSVEAFDVDD